MTEKEHNNNGLTNKIGFGLALGFYVLSVIMVIVNSPVNSGVLDRDTTTITIAHWQLENGFREGFDEAIKQYEALKAKEGIKVKVVQTTVPFRGYPQWFVTQLISGNPADIVELYGGFKRHDQYFVPLSNYISQPNPYNKGTPLAGIPWKDTYVDGMNSALDKNYAEYFGVGTFFHVIRVCVNKKLLKEATGSDKMPTTFKEWMDDCRKLREYGKKMNKSIIPIGVRGFDKETLNFLFKHYFSQLNGNLNDTGSVFCLPRPSFYEISSKMAEGKIDKNRLLNAVDLIKELGMNFCEGFTATNSEQTRFLFFTGKVGFLPDGTYNAWTMIKNSPFEVELINIPVIGPNNRFYKNFTGQTSELGVGVGGKFGIPKASKHFDLALDFLRFLTSWRINQLTMMDYCKWPPVVIKAEYKGLLKKFQPTSGDAMSPVFHPFGLRGKSTIKMLETLERIIINDIHNPQVYFWQKFKSDLPVLIEEVESSLAGEEQGFFDLEGQRSCIAAGLLEKTARRKRQNLEKRYRMAQENLSERMRQQYNAEKTLINLRNLEKKSEEKSIVDDKEEK